MSPRQPPRPVAQLAVGAAALAVGASVTTLALTATSPSGLLGIAAATGGVGTCVLGWLLLRRAARANAATRADLASAQQKLEQLQLRVQDLNSAQGRFVGNIAHELKTPLATVLAQSELLQSCSNDPLAVQRYAKGIGEDMRHMSNLVESFLRLARPYAQEDRSHHEPVCFHDFVVDAVRRSQALARESGVTVVAKLAEPVNGDAPVEVLGDPLLLEAMVENLVRNAIRFSPRGARVDVVVEARDGRTLLFVRDSGSGIAAEHLAHVFDWFFEPSIDARRSLGTGFGLAIARRVAEHHGGTIELRNRKEGGCEFEVQLPTCVHAAAPTAPASPAPAAQAPGKHVA